MRHYQSSWLEYLGESRNGTWVSCTSLDFSLREEAFGEAAERRYTAVILSGAKNLSLRIFMYI